MIRMKKKPSVDTMYIRSFRTDVMFYGKIQDVEACTCLRHVPCLVVFYEKKNHNTTLHFTRIEREKEKKRMKGNQSVSGLVKGSFCLRLWMFA